MHQNLRLSWNVLAEFDHLPAERVACSYDCLDCRETMTQDEERQFGGLLSDILDNRPEDDLWSRAIIERSGVFVLFRNSTECCTLDTGGFVLR